MFKFLKRLKSQDEKNKDLVFFRIGWVFERGVIEKVWTDLWGNIDRRAKCPANLNIRKGLH